MSVSNEDAKKLSAGVWAVSFVVLFFGFMFIGGLISSEVAIFGSLLSTFIIAPALAIYTYLRAGGDMNDIWNAFINTNTTENKGGPVSDEQLEIKMIESESIDPDSEPNSLGTLRERYATGKLTDEQFERKVERLLQTDTTENAAEWQERTRESVKE